MSCYSALNLFEKFIILLKDNLVMDKIQPDYFNGFVTSLLNVFESCRVA